MRLMNGRLGNLVRSPLMRNANYLTNGQAAKQRRHSSGTGEEMPRAVQFDESSDQYRCLCGCFHVKTGAYLIASLELLLLLILFLNSLLVLIQQQDDVDPSATVDQWGSQFVRTAFTVECVCLTFALASVLLLLVGVGLNSAPMLVPHLVLQCVSLFCLFLVLIVATIALITDLSSAYRLLNVVPFNAFPGQTTVAFSAETAARVYAMCGLYFGIFLSQCWFVRIIYNCNRYFHERRRYMRYCLAYSTPLKTLYSAR